jgi:hypothetical protein
MIPNFSYKGKTAVRTLSALMSPVSVALVITPSPSNRTLTGALENGARIHSGIRNQLTPRVMVSGREHLMIPPEAPRPSTLPVISPGEYVRVVPVYDIWMAEPLVTDSRRRRKEIS